MTHERDEEAITRIARAFDSAVLRFLSAQTFEEQEDETSNLLHHLYRLAQARFGDQWKGLATARGDLRLVPALVWLRHNDVHDFVQISAVTDAVSDAVTNLVGTLAWRIPEPDNDDRWQRYQAVPLLDGQPVIDLILRARDALVYR